LAVTVEAAVRGAEDSWESKLSVGLKAGLEFLANDPALARRLLVEPLEVTGGEARMTRERWITRLAEALQPPVELRGGEPVSDEILRFQAHGLVSYLSGRALTGGAEALPEDHDALLGYLLAFSRSSS
jgi:hypothetical protein